MEVKNTPGNEHLQQRPNESAEEHRARIIMSLDEASNVYSGMKDWLKLEYDQIRDYQKVSVGGIVLLVVTFGLNLDKLAVLGWFGKASLILSFILFFIAVLGTHLRINNLHDTLVSIHCHESQSVIKMREGEMAVSTVDEYFNKTLVNPETAESEWWAHVSHICVALAIILAAVVFCSIIVVS